MAQVVKALKSSIKLFDDWLKKHDKQSKVTLFTPLPLDPNTMEGWPMDDSAKRFEGMKNRHFSVSGGPSWFFHKTLADPVVTYLWPKIGLTQRKSANNPTTAKTAKAIIHTAEELSHLYCCSVGPGITQITPTNVWDAVVQEAKGSEAWTEETRAKFSKAFMYLLPPASNMDMLLTSPQRWYACPQLDLGHCGRGSQSHGNSRAERNWQARVKPRESRGSDPHDTQVSGHRQMQLSTDLAWLASLSTKHFPLQSQPGCMEDGHESLTLWASDNSLLPTCSTY